MGQKLKIWATMTSIILLSGILGFGFSPDASALSEQGAEKGTANGCEKGVAKNNPHCNGSGGFTDCDTDLSGAIEKAEIVALGFTSAQADSILANAELLVVSPDTNMNGKIDTTDELAHLNSFLAPADDCV